MVKGTARRIILVKSPDRSVFEEAIFVVREDARSSSLTPDGIISEAQSVAADYIKTHLHRGKKGPLSPGAYMLLGAAAAGSICALLSVLI